MALLLILALASTPARAQCPPGPPVGFTASSGMCDVLLSWLPPAGGGAFNYFVYRGSGNVISTAELIGVTSLPFFTDDPPQKGQRYYYWVRSMPNPTLCGQLGGLSSPEYALTAMVESNNIDTFAESCSVLRIVWQPLRGATSYKVVRFFVNGNNDLEQDKVVVFSTTSTLSLDNSGIHGARYQYIVYPFAACDIEPSGDPKPATFPDDPRVAFSGGTAHVGEQATLHAYATGPSSIFTTYAWYRGTQRLSDSSKYSGVSTNTLTINNVTLADEGSYRVSVTNDCGGETAYGVLAVTQACPGDFNHSGAISVQDIFDFLAAYFAGCP
jgi:hypothetical protein